MDGVAIVETPQGRVEASSPQFKPALETMLRQGADARDRLLGIERKQIGAISRELEALGRAEKSGAVDSGTAAARRAVLQKDFDQLQAKAAEIRAEIVAVERTTFCP